MRLLLIVLFAGLALALPMAGAASEKKPDAPLDEPVTLRTGVIVNDDYVRLGDLFTGAGERADTVVAYAPDPGKATAFDARWLYRLARSQGLDWQPIGMRDRALVRRDAHTIGREQIEDTIARRLVREGVEGPVEAVLSERSLRLHVAGDAPTTVGIEDLVFDTTSGRFSALIASPADDPAAQRVRVTGRMWRMIDVPVLTERKIAGDIIHDSDVRVEAMRIERLPRDAISDVSQLVGQEVRRGIVPGKPVRQMDVQKPVLVAKGSLVTVTLKGPYLMLTARGKALESGSLGDTIRMTNLQSKTTLEGVITGAGTATVEPIAKLALN